MTYSEILLLASAARRHAVNLENWVKLRVRADDDLEFIAACIQSYDLDAMKAARPVQSKTAIRREAQRLKLPNYWAAPVEDLLILLKANPDSSYFDTIAE